MWGPAALAAGPRTPSANASAPTTSEATSPAATSTAERLVTIPFLSPTACLSIFGGAFTGAEAHRR